ncbi:MAG: DMT family transporter [Acidobacteriota bacterium]|nr:DMT family transporter [Acidobacteriota bacterium]
MSPNFILYGLIALMVLLWSGNYIAAKIAFREIPALLVMSIRMIIAALLIGPVYWRQLSRRVTPMTWGEGRLLALLGVAGITMNQFFWVMGTARTTVVHSSMIMATIPVWVLMMAGFMKLERITWPKLLGMAIAIAGIAVLQIFKPAKTGAVATFLGDALVMLCALIFAALTAYGKRYRPAGGGIAVNAVAYIGGAIILAPALWWAGRGFDFTRVSWLAWASVVYMAALSSVACYLIYYWALARIEASRMAAVQYLQPVLASAMAVMMLSERMSAATVAAGGIILTGVYVTERFG